MDTARLDGGGAVEFRASRRARSGAVLVAVAAIGLLVWGLVVQVDSPDPSTWPVGLAFVGGLLLVARAVRSVRVAGLDGGLAVHTGLRTFTVPWGLVQGFWRRPDFRYGGAYVLIAPHDIVYLPLGQRVWRSGRGQADDMVNVLTTAARRNGAPIWEGDLAVEARRRLPRGEPRRRWERPH